MVTNTRSILVIVERTSDIKQLDYLQMTGNFEGTENISDIE